MDVLTPAGRAALRADADRFDRHGERGQTRAPVVKFFNPADAATWLPPEPDQLPPSDEGGD